MPRSSASRICAVRMPRQTTPSSRRFGCGRDGGYPPPLPQPLSLRVVAMQNDPQLKIASFEWNSMYVYLPWRKVQTSNEKAQISKPNNSDGATAKLVQWLQSLSPTQRIWLTAFQAVLGKMSGKLNIPTELDYRVKARINARHGRKSSPTRIWIGPHLSKKLQKK